MPVARGALFRGDFAVAPVNVVAFLRLSDVRLG